MDLTEGSSITSSDLERVLAKGFLSRWGSIKSFNFMFIYIQFYLGVSIITY